MLSLVVFDSVLDFTRSLLMVTFVSNWCSGVPATYAPGGHRLVLAPAGVHAHGTPHPSRGLCTLLLRWASRPQRQTAQREGEALPLQFHHPGYVHTLSLQTRCTFWCNTANKTTTYIMSLFFFVGTISTVDTSNYSCHLLLTSIIERRVLWCVCYPKVKGKKSWPCNLFFLFQSYPVIPLWPPYSSLPMPAARRLPLPQPTPLPPQVRAAPPPAGTCFMWSSFCQLCSSLHGKKKFLRHRWHGSCKRFKWQSPPPVHRW